MPITSVATTAPPMSAGRAKNASVTSVVSHAPGATMSACCRVSLMIPFSLSCPAPLPRSFAPATLASGSSAALAYLCAVQILAREGADVSTPAETDDRVIAILQASAEMSARRAAYTQIVAERFGLAATDVECLGLLASEGSMAVGRLGELTALTTGATTRMVDRLEQAG